MPARPPTSPRNTSPNAFVFHAQTACGDEVFQHIGDALFASGVLRPSKLVARLLGDTGLAML